MGSGIVYRIYRRVYRLLYHSAPIQRIFNWRVRYLTRAVLKRSLQTDSEYQQYVHGQIKKSYDMVSRYPRGLGLAERTKHLVGLMDKFLPTHRDSYTVLCVGCRNENELEYIEDVCRVKTQGLDLFSVHPKITTGDMHKMPYADNTFDALYSCHSLEHAYDLQRAVREFIRVTKAAGLLVIEIPINYRLSVTDRWDLKSSESLLDCLSDVVSEVLFREDTDEVARVIARIKK